MKSLNRWQGNFLDKQKETILRMRINNNNNNNNNKY